MHWCSVIIVTVCLVKPETSHKWAEGDIRLVGGPRRYMGTVVIFHNGKWGAVCDNQWDMKDVSVVCRQLGYTMAIRATTRSEFGPGRRRVWLKQVHCNGQEERLNECSFQGYDENTHYKCPARYRSAGAICSAAISTTTSEMSLTGIYIPSTEISTTAANKSIITLTSVILEEMVQARTEDAIETTNVTLGTIPENATPKVERQVIKRILESDAKDAQKVIASFVSSVTAVTELTVQTPAYAPIVNENVFRQYLTEDDEVESVNKSESAIPQNMNESNIIYKEENSNNNSANSSLYKTDVSLLCKSAIQDKNSEECEAYFADDPKVENFDIRLKGGRYKWEGHLQIRINDGEWGTACSDHWTLREAMVACNQLGEFGRAKQALTTSYFGGMDMPKIVHKIECVGRESTFASCNVTRSGKEETCSKKAAVAGVVCSQYLPDLIPSLRAIEDSVRLQDQPLYYLRCAMEENCLASSAYMIKNTSLTWRNNMRRLLRFSTVVHNKGLADFRPYRPRGQWEWHACHMHYHSMEIFAHYDILDSKGTRLAEGSKASFCLEDTTCDTGVHPQYNCRGFADQGLSVNCSDNYMYDIDCQWIDISDIKPGEYTFLMEVNPTMMVAESNFDNNIVSCRLYYSGYFASVRNCHYESLLDYRV